VFWLVGIEGRRGAGSFHGAEAATARAGVAHEHDGCGSCGFIGAAPAVGDVGAAGLLANCMQVEATQVFFDLLIVGI